MASSILAIEFDQTIYHSTIDCDHWITNNPDLQGLKELKGFKLRSAKSIVMSSEPRKVWQWIGDLWRYKNWENARPTNGILVIARNGGETWTETDVPSLSEKTLKRRREADKKRAAKHRTILNRKAEQERKRKEKSEAVNSDEDSKKEKKERKKRGRTAVKEHKNLAIKKAKREQQKIKAKVKKLEESFESSEGDDSGTDDDIEIDSVARSAIHVSKKQKVSDDTLVAAIKKELPASSSSSIPVPTDNAPTVFEQT